MIVLAGFNSLVRMVLLPTFQGKRRLGMGVKEGM